MARGSRRSSQGGKGKGKGKGSGSGSKKRSSGTQVVVGVGEIPDKPIFDLLPRYYFGDPNPRLIDVASCVPGSRIREVREQGVLDLIKSITAHGYSQDSIICVVATDDGIYKVVNGMHRVTALQRLRETDRENGLDESKYDTVIARWPVGGCWE